MAVWNQEVAPGYHSVASALNAKVSLTCTREAIVSRMEVKGFTFLTLSNVSGSVCNFCKLQSKGLVNGATSDQSSCACKSGAAVIKMVVPFPACTRQANVTTSMQQLRPPPKFKHRYQKLWFGRCYLRLEKIWHHYGYLSVKYIYLAILLVTFLGW